MKPPTRRAPGTGKLTAPVRTGSVGHRCPYRSGPTNNHAERELRGLVMWRRRSFGSQSEHGTRFAARMMTVAHTARKQGREILEFLAACCAPRPEGAAAPSWLASA